MDEKLPTSPQYPNWESQKDLDNLPIEVGWLDDFDWDLADDGESPDDHVDDQDKDEYWVDPASLHRVAGRLQDVVASSRSFAEVCQKMTPTIAEHIDVRGIENIPAQGPLVVIKNHPCHFDSLLLGQIFQERPDVRSLTKVSFLTDPLPDEYVVRLRKEGARANPDDARMLKAYLAAGGSLMAVPWGAMDYQAKEYAGFERTMQNVVRYASFHDAAVLPVTLFPQWGRIKQLPLKDMKVTIGQPLYPTRNDVELLKTIEAVSEMYDQFAR